MERRIEFDKTLAWQHNFMFFYKFIFPILLQAKLETKALKAKRPGFTDDRYKETAYYVENGKSISKICLLKTAQNIIISNKWNCF